MKVSLKTPVAFNYYARILRQAKQGLAPDRIDFVERKDRLAAGRSQTVDDTTHIGVDPALAIDQNDQHIGIGGAGPGGIDHGALKALLGRENTRRVDEDDLGIAKHRNATDLTARGLHFMGDDRNLGANQPVEQRRFTGVRRAYNGHEPAIGPGTGL